MSRKLLIALTADGRVGRSIVVPDIVRPVPGAFIGLERDLSVQLAVVAYSGTPVTAVDLLKRFWRSTARQPAESAFPVLEEFVEQLARIPIGTVVSINYEAGHIVLLKEASAPPSDRRPKLP